MDSIIYYNTDQYKYESYVTDLNNGNFENNPNDTLVGAGIERNHINNGYIYSDIDNQ